MTLLRGLHHVAYRCRNAQRTIDFYTKALDLEFAMAMSEERVPTTGAECPYMHVFFKMGDGSFIAFFDLADAEPMQFDPNTPPWVQHLALEIADSAAMATAVERLTNYGVEVIGPIDHDIFRSVYFHDPDGHRVELTYRTEKPESLQALRDAALPMMEEWNLTRKAVDHVAWVHSTPKH